LGTVGKKLEKIEESIEKRPKNIGDD